MTAVLLALGASLAWGVSDFGGGSAARRHSTLTVLLLMRIGGVALIAALALATAAPWVGPRWPLAVAAAFVTSLGGITLLRALAIGPMGITAPIVAGSGAVPALAGLLGGQVPEPTTLAGLAVAGCGAVLASRASGHAGERVRREGVAYAVATAVLLGTGLLLVHEASDRSATSAVLLERAVEVVLLLGALALGRARLTASSLPDRALLLGIGALEACAITSYATASTLGSLTLVAVLSSLYPVVTALLARAVHDERLSAWQAAGSLMTLAGVAAVVASTV